MVDMVIQINVAGAKARLSELLAAAAGGDDVVIARSGRPVARLVPVAAPDPRRLGFMPGAGDDHRFDPLDDAALAGLGVTARVSPGAD